MKIAIISDIHSNLEALNEVLKIIDNNIEPDKIINLGDTIGYGPNPKECTKIIRERNIPSILGNHEAAVCKIISDSNFNPYAKYAVDWTKDQLDEREIKYYSKLPNQIIMDEIKVMFIHGALTERFDYILNSPMSRNNFKIMRQNYKDINVCFFGHSHVPTYGIDDFLELAQESANIKIEENRKYLVNFGSVGQPRGGISINACFGVYDTDENIIQYYDIPYDVKKTYTKIIEKGLPTYLADRLLVGR